jgi:molybdate transport system substrate-binding protein
VFAAASLSDALNEVGDSFEEETGLEIVFNFAGSQTLAQQIVASGRGDLFISADDAWMDFVVERGSSDTKSRRALLGNHLAIVCSSNAAFTLDQPKNLTSLDFKYLCIGEPDAVPAGRYAKRWLESLNIWAEVRDRVSPAPNVRAAIEQAIGRTDSIGIVYQTEFMRAGDRARLLGKIPDAPVRYPMSLLRDGKAADGAKRFYEFLQSEKAKRVFEAFGFDVLQE